MNLSAKFIQPGRYGTVHNFSKGHSRLALCSRGISSHGYEVVECRKEKNN